MKRFDAILVPHDGSSEAAKALGCASWLAQELDATLHVLGPASIQIPAAHRARLVHHDSTEQPDAAVLGEISAHEIKLVVMTARGESASAGVDLSRHVGHVAQAVIERTPVPVLLLPARYEETLPWRSMLVALSGERASDRALEAAVELANALRIELVAAHCDDDRSAQAPLGVYADAPQYEFPGRLDEMVRRGLAGRAPGEQRCIHELLLCRGDPADEILGVARQRGASVLALGWHGTLGEGRARVLKRLLAEAHPLLLVRSTERSPALLKVGAQFGDS